MVNKKRYYLVYINKVLQEIMKEPKRERTTTTKNQNDLIQII